MERLIDAAVMNMAAPVSEYELFEYKNFDEPTMSLEEAMKKAARLRISDNTHFHRVVPNDSSMTSFRVESVSPAEVYSDLLGRWSDLFSRVLRRSSKR